MTQMNDLNKSIHANQKSEKSRKDETIVNTLIEYGIELKNEVDFLNAKLKASEEKLIENESLFYDRLIQSQNNNAILLNKLNILTDIQKKLEKQNADLEDRLIKIAKSAEENKKNQLEVFTVSYYSLDSKSSGLNECVPLLNDQNSYFNRLLDRIKRFKLKSLIMHKHSSFYYHQPIAIIRL